MKTKQIKYYSGFFFLCSILMLFSTLIANYNAVYVEIFNTTASGLMVLTLIGSTKLLFEVQKMDRKKTIVVHKN